MLGGALICSASTPGCERNGEADERVPQAASAAAPLAAPSAAASTLLSLLGDAAAPVGSAGAVATEALKRKLDLSPGRHPMQRLAAAKRRVAQLTAGELVIRQGASKKPTLSVDVRDPRAVVSLVDQSFAVVTGEGVFVVPEQAEAPKDVERYPRITVFPHSRVFGDRVKPRRLWVLHPFGDSLYAYDLEESERVLAAFAESITLEDYDHRAFSWLRDGSFVYSSPDGLRRVFPGGRPKTLKGDTKELFRLLPAREAAAFWSVRTDGSVTLSRASKAATPIRSVELEHRPFAASSDEDLLAVLELGRHESGSRFWVIEVFQESGKRRFSKQLEATAPDGEDWASALVKDGGIAVSKSAGLVTVGGPERISVLSLSPASGR